jgi:hypothetical protein
MTTYIIGERHGRRGGRPPALTSMRKSGANSSSPPHLPSSARRRYSTDDAHPVDAIHMRGGSCSGTAGKRYEGGGHP